MAETVRLQIEEIETMTDRAHAYTILLHLQRQSANDASAMESLARFSPPLVPSLLQDSHSPDEEIAALALKCLGFNLYHPALVATLSEEVARSVLDSLVNLILATPMKAICNLGIWCLSVQQLNASVLELTAQSVVHAITYALDNPFGSVSVTLEASQALIKLTSQIPNCNKDLSSMWAPPIYRRLVSTDKTQSDMAERCLLKLFSVLSPPHITLSKEVASDLNRNLIVCMRSMIHDNQKKVQTIKAWGWFIYLLGLDASENTRLINEMLKFPENTFTDSDPQIQIATLVSWRQLIDALQPQITSFKDNLTTGTILQPFLKKIKLVLVPLKGIMSKKCNLAVQSCCLRTWLYLIHKLGHLLNRLLILEIAFGSFLEIIFSIGPDMPLWASCVDLFHQCILSKIEQKESNIDGCAINWVPWNANLLDFHLKMIGIIFSVQNPKSKEAGLKVFRTLIQGIKIELKRSCNCVKSIFKFFQELCEAKQCDDSSWLCLEFVRCLKANPNDSSEIHFFESLCEILCQEILMGTMDFLLKTPRLGEITTAIMENAMVFEHSKCLFSIKNGLGLVSRFLRLSSAALNSNPQAVPGIINRVTALLSNLISEVSSMQDIILLFEVIADPLIQLMSLHTIMDHEVQYAFIQELNDFWSRILDCLNRSQPPVFTNPSFFEDYSSLFEKALEHPDSAISNATAEFLKSKLRFDNFSKDNAYKRFENNSGRFGTKMNEKGSVNISGEQTRNKLKITECVANTLGHDTRRNYGHLIGSCSKVQVASDNGKGRREMRRPELILEMLKRKSKR